MATVRMMIKKDDRPSDEQIKSLHSSKPEKITFDDESPELSDEILRQFKRVNPKKNAARM
ncbi:MAG: hypothetical protein J5829_02640 [Lachnospiraceae bacterium]|nr:hypothetical protein [Lachnospiraceae bacterium]